MTTNEGAVDRGIRAVAGVALLGLSLTMLRTPLNVVAGIVGVVLLATAAIGFCPLYRLLGVSTCKR